MAVAAAHARAAYTSLKREQEETCFVFTWVVFTWIRGKCLL